MTAYDQLVTPSLSLKQVTTTQIGGSEMRYGDYSYHMQHYNLPVQVWQDMCSVLLRKGVDATWSEPVRLHKDSGGRQETDAP